MKNIKAKHLKKDRRNYYRYNGYHINYSVGRYWLTWLYNSLQFKTLKELKEYIKNN